MPLNISIASIIDQVILDGGSDGSGNAMAYENLIVMGYENGIAMGYEM